MNATDRLRWLASDDNPDAWSRAGYRALLAGPRPEPPAIARPTPTPEDQQLLDYIAAHPCGGCH